MLGGWAGLAGGFFTTSATWEAQAGDHYLKITARGAEVVSGEVVDPEVAVL